MAKRRSVIKTREWLFLDSSVLFSAVYSSFGGSAKLFVTSEVWLVTSTVVLHEVEKNVHLKLPRMYLERFFKLVTKLKVITELPSIKRRTAAKKVIADKDSVILATFVESKCNVLITLDKQDFLQRRVEEYVKPKMIMTPKMWFEAQD